MILGDKCGDNRANKQRNNLSNLDLEHQKIILDSM